MNYRTSRHIHTLFSLGLLAALSLQSKPGMASEPASLQGTPDPPFKRALQSTASVVEGEVIDISFSYDEWYGPRTNVTLRNVVTHLGSFADREVMLPMIGGPMPNGHRLVVSDQPKFQYGCRYMVFLLRGRWQESPVMSSFALMSAGSVDFLASHVGMAVSRFDDEMGFHYGEQRLFSIPIARDRNTAYNPPVRSQLLETFGETLARQITTKDAVVASLRTAMKKYNIPMAEPFVPMPQQLRPWNETQVGP
jgi:hypothetical protein